MIPGEGMVGGVLRVYTSPYKPLGYTPPLT